eukprot:TRINITY_DN13232_c0_g1_i1.p1 TRINITY_DN13232_c0_g1~~TRINITY_DN13232_c0_g1_i1.p1  ORF type:complete len:385 (+),score=89.60 TRINITY_DN13232_c0_g1_i1:170-1324(+)
MSSASRSQQAAASSSTSGLYSLVGGIGGGLGGVVPTVMTVGAPPLPLPPPPPPPPPPTLSQSFHGALGHHNGLTMRKRKRSVNSAPSEISLGIPPATPSSDEKIATSSQDLEKNLKYAKAVDETLRELDEIFEFMEKCKDTAMGDREQVDANQDVQYPKEFAQRLGIFLEVVQPLVVNGEPTPQVRFTGKYRNLSVSSKIRLLRIAQREEIAMDILQNYFSNLSDYHRIQLLEASPVKKIPIATEIWKVFGAMTAPYRSSFIRACPVEYLTEVVLKHLSILTVGETIQALKRLPDCASNKVIQKTVCSTLWNRKNQFEYPDDFLEFASLIETNNLSIKFFPLIEEMASVARQKLREHQQARKTIQQLQQDMDTLQSTSKAPHPS